MAEAFLDLHDAEITRLERKFSSYSLTQITKTEIRFWLRQFREEHMGLGLRLLQSVDFYDPARITTSFGAAHEMLLATMRDESLEGVFFFPFGLAGKSGGALLYNYRTANNIPIEKCKYHVTDLTSLFADAEQRFRLVFVDDLIGTGNQAIESWDLIRETTLPRDSEVFLVTLAGFDQAITAVSERTDLRVMTPRVLTDEDRIFSQTNTCFDEDEKRILKGYCENVRPWPEGFGNTQSLTVFYHRIPNNTISILRCLDRAWKPLFPRQIIPP